MKLSRYIKNMFFMSLFFSFSLCHAQIKPVNTMDEIITAFKEADTDTLALFDIDMVILQPKDPAFQMANMKRYSSLIKKIMQQIPAGKRDIFLVLTSLCSETVLINSELPKLLNELTQKNIPKIALTGNFTGAFAGIENMEQWKIERLLHWGIDFSQGAPFSEEIVFRDLPLYRGNYSIYTRGILFVNGSVCPKGDALIAFLKKTGCAPKKVIFIDDREENLKSVEAALTLFMPEVEFKGLHFTGAKDYPSPTITEEAFESKWQAIAMKIQDIN